MTHRAFSAQIVYDMSDSRGESSVVGVSVLLYCSMQCFVSDTGRKDDDFSTPLSTYLPTSRRSWSSNLVKSIRHALRLEDQQLTSSPEVLEASSYKLHLGSGTLHSDQAQLSASVQSYCVGNFWISCCALHWSRFFITFLLRYRRIWHRRSLCVCFSHTLIEICDIFYDT